MIELKQFMTAVNYRITEGSEYGWQCYGSWAHSLDSWNGDHDGHSASIVFDTKTQEVYEVSAYDYANQRAYRLINPNYQDAYDNEATERGVASKEAWDEVEFVDLDVVDDFLEKLTAIVVGKDYDTRVQMPVEFSDEDLFTYMKLAHEKDITLNQLITEALQMAIDDAKKQGLLSI